MSGSKAMSSSESGSIPRLLSRSALVLLSCGAVEPVGESGLGDACAA
jgi:hypothetical protein